MKLPLVAGVLLAMARPALAADPRPITLAEAVAQAERNAPAVIQAEGQTRTSVADVRAAYASFLPSLSVSAGATRQLPAGGRTRVENGQIITLASDPWSTSLGLGASVDLFDGGQRFFDVRQAHAREVGARVGELLQRYGAALAAKQEFFNVLAARESQAAAQSQLQQAEQQSRFSMARVRARNATRSDSLRAEIQVRTARLAVVQAANDLDVSNASLTRVIGSDLPVTAAPESLPAPTLALDDASLQTMAENGPVVRQAKAAYDAARAARSGAWSDFLPSISAAYSRTGSGTGSTLAFDPTGLNYSGALRLSLSFPIFNQWQRESQTTQAQVTLRNADATLHDARLAARQSLVQSLGAFRLAAERVASQAATVAAAEEDLRVQQQRYAVGGSTQLDVLTSQTQLDQARRDLIRAHYDQRVAKAQLESLVGRDL